MSVLYALFLIDETGVPWFAGAYQTHELAENKGKASGKKFEVRTTTL